MINLYYNYYYSDNSTRQKDIDFCFDKNMAIETYDRIYLIISESDYKRLLDYTPLNFMVKNIASKIIFILFEKQPSFSNYIDIINAVSDEDDINIFLNSDCYACEKTIENVYRIKKDEMWCLQKYNIIDEDFNLFFEDVSCSQDVWIFRGKPKEIKNIDFYFGVPGCDNRFAYESEASGYTLLNPSLDIKFYHYHLSEVRTCPYEHWEKYRIPEPYKFIEPTKIIQEL